MTPIFELGRYFCTVHLPRSFIILCWLVRKLSCWQTHKCTNTQTNKQTLLKTPNALRYHTTLGKEYSVCSNNTVSYSGHSYSTVCFNESWVLSCVIKHCCMLHVHTHTHAGQWWWRRPMCQPWLSHGRIKPTPNTSSSPPTMKSFPTVLVLVHRFTCRNNLAFTAVYSIVILYTFFRHSVTLVHCLEITKHHRYY